MADMDPETAFLEAQDNEQEYDPAADYSHLANQPEDDDDDDDDDEEYDPASAFAEVARSPSAQSASMPESAANSPPGATATATATAIDGALKPPPADAAAQSPSKKVRLRGGFVDESSEDEEGDVSIPQASSALLNASGAPESPQRSVTLSPNNTHAQQTMPSSSAHDQAVPGVSSSVAVPEISSAASAPSGGTPVPDATKTAPPSHPNVASARQSDAGPAIPVSASLPKARLPQDRVGLLEDRIADDPRGDIEAWLGLIEEHRRRHKHEEARAVFERFLQVFPSAGEQWVEYVNMETELDNFKQVEALFGRSLTQTPYIPLWSSYINYIRRINNLTTDQTGQARSVVIQVYEFVLDSMGIDINSGKIWTDYIELLKTGPGMLGGSNWQDMQKMDSLRKAYQRAIAVPTNATLEIWREYDRFEMNLNKVTGRKYLQEKSASYVTARSAINVLDNITKGVNRTTLPKLPPAPGFDGADEYARQVQAWKHWIEWEKNDPLEIKEDDRALYNKRILYLYKNASMALRFWPELWYDAAEWCYQNSLNTEGDEFLKNGTAANPESCLLAFKQAHQAELRTDFEDGEAGLIEKGKAVRAPLMTVLDALYDLTNKAKKREEQTVAKAKEIFAAQQAAEDAARNASDMNSDDDDEDVASAAAKRQKERQDALDAQLQGITKASNAEIHTLKKTLSCAWVALMRAMRRVQGKGSPGAAVGGFRGVFAEARKRGKLLSNVYIASALIEHYCYRDPAATKIFERGMKLFTEDEEFALEYIKHLVKSNDATNARAVFETIVNRLTQKLENVHRAKPLFIFFHDYESQFGELAQITKLEQRMATLFPEDPQLQRFSSRFANPTFDPTAMRPIISPRTQMRPVMPAGVMPTVEEPHSAVVPHTLMQQEQRVASPAILNSPRLCHLLPATNSPKRPLEDAENDQPRKMVRGESPIKGAAGRRLAAARGNPMVGGNTPVAAPAPLPREINFLFSIIPPAHTYGDTTRFNPEALVQLLRHITLPLPQNLHPGAPPPVATGPPAAHINTQLQNIQARYGSGGWQ
ncbi:Suf-domain-containing protein [Lentithecium fluviatile CBS 122367]|uniref:mRNA 3'-end-processing protein RNA14 n=1 Tax=Lentithecium fluviatile CBS 122367 TaxID=1168545 RepID=A0A6G1J651_9PLEO|nr:Suf-domain-containing protein [Lentithecium fluviatile CBS 122367]